MKKIAILRGINVGGKRKILMKDLKLVFEKLNFKDITSYIQSGNIVFDSAEGLDNNLLELKIKKAILDNFGFDVPVIIRTQKEINEIIAENPFLQNDVDISHLHLTFLNKIPEEQNLKLISKMNFSPDRFLINGKNIYIYCEGKYHKSKLTNNFFEKKLKVTATTRNWKTVLKLSELSNL
ncbi:MAG TPA: DUF1697 domain-containing protein [Bacteroidetes bacterium]|nr:DUF1697 domain-containing protein [Bacteroidota bacterium]